MSPIERCHYNALSGFFISRLDLAQRKGYEVVAVDQLLSLKQVCERLSVSKSFVYERIAAGELPAPIHLVPNRLSRWPASAVQKFIDSRSAS